MSEKPKAAPLTDPEAFFLRMIECDLGDWELERRHFLGDALMMELLRILGYGKAIDLFDSWNKWYT